MLYVACADEMSDLSNLLLNQKQRQVFRLAGHQAKHCLIMKLLRTQH